MSGHHEYGPSTLDSLSLCVRFKYAPQEDGAANEGTLLHSAFETGNLTGLDDEQRRCVQTVRDYAESLKFERGMTPSDWEDFAERSVSLKGLTYGTADRMLFCRKTGRLHVIDAKFTRVDARHDFQLKAYGAALAEEWNERDPGSVVTVVTHVVAPRLGPSDPVEYDAAILVSSVRAELESLYAGIENPFTPPSPHEDLCGRCARASVCPALAVTVRAAVRGAGLPLPDAFRPEAMVSSRDRAIGQLLASVLINWGEQVKRNNAAYVASGGEIPGFRRMRRSLGLRIPRENTAAAISALTGEEPDLSVPEILGCCSLTVGEVVARLSSLRGIPEAEAKEIIRERLGELAVEGFSDYLAKERRLTDGEALNGLIVGQNKGE